MQKPQHHLTQKKALDAETLTPPHPKDSTRCRNLNTTSQSLMTAQQNDSTALDIQAMVG